MLQTYKEYETAGAWITEDVSESPVIIGVKTVPIETLLPEKTYVFFSHTIKAQEANMPLLDSVLEKVPSPQPYQVFNYIPLFASRTFV